MIFSIKPRKVLFSLSQLRLIFSILIVVTLSACQSNPAIKSVSDSEKVQNQASEIVTKKKIEPAYPHLELTENLLFDFLVAGIAFDSGDYDKSYNLYVKLMEQTADPRLNKLIIKSALASKNNEYMLHAANIWGKIEPANRHIQQIKSVVLLKLKRDKEAAQSLSKVIEVAENKQEGFKKVEMFLSTIKDEKRINEIFTQLQKNFNDDFYLYLTWAKFVSHYDDGANAINKIDSALRLKPNNTMALLIKLEIYKKFKPINTLNSVYLDAVNAAESPVMVRLEYAKYLLEQKKNTAAIEQLEIITKTVKDNRRILYEIGLLAMDIKEYSTAEKFFKQYYSFEPNANGDKGNKAIAAEEKNKAAYAIGKALLENKKLKDALPWFNKVSPGQYQYQSILHRILIHAELENFQKSLDLLGELSPKQEEQKRTLSRLKGDILFQSKAYQKAYDAYTQAIAIHSYEANSEEYIELLYNRALTSEKLDLVKQMEEDLLFILKKEPDNSNVLNTLGFLLTEKTDRYKEAQAYIEKALELDPDDMATIDSMGWVLYQQGFLKKSLHYLEKAYKLEKDPEISAHYGEVLWQLENRELARKVWESAIKKHPEHHVLKKTIKRFLRK